MDLGIQDWVTGLLGFQSVAQTGAQQIQLQNPHASVVCSDFLAQRPAGFESVSLAMVRDNFAVVPADWFSSGILKPWYSIDSHDSLSACMTGFREAAFTAFDTDFLDFITKDATFEMFHAFSSVDANHVHEAPVYVRTTNELVFADTSVIGWLWALEVDTQKIRKINTSPPLENVNGATIRDSHIYLTTNGGRAPAIWKCSIPRGHTLVDSNSHETIACTPVVNNYHLKHFNSPNDLIFTASDNILFTDPTYGWTQSWPGVGAPELPTALYHFNTRTGALVTLTNELMLQPNGLALSLDEKTLYVADSNSTSGKPIQVWEHSVRNVYAFDFDEATLSLSNRRLVHVVESGWPDGLRVTRMTGKDGKERELVLVATMGGVDVVDASAGGAGILLGKFNVGSDIIFNLEPVVKAKQFKSGERADTWLLTGMGGVYKVTIGSPP